MKKNTRKPKRIRNSIACHPLLRKGGIHGKTEKAKRRADKQSLRREWPVLIPLRAVSGQRILATACGALAGISILPQMR